MTSNASGKKWSEESRNKIRGKNNHQFGKVPWNKGKEHLAAKNLPQAFKKGHTPWIKGKHAWNYIGRGKMRRNNLRRNGKAILKSRVVWCENNYTHIPNGFVIHHIDLNHKNNNPENLFLMESQDHNSLHHKFSQYRRENGIF